MSKWWHYPAWRRRALQAVVWALLGAMLGVAAISSSHRRAVKDARFSPAIACGPYAVRVPKMWRVVTHSVADQKLEAFEEARSARTRRVSVYQKQVPPDTSIAEILQVEGIAVEAASEGDDEQDTSEQVTIAGNDGMMYWRATGRFGPKAEYVGVVIAPDGQALAVRMVVGGPLNESDRSLFRDILQRISRPNP